MGPGAASSCPLASHHGSPVHLPSASSWVTPLPSSCARHLPLERWVGRDCAGQAGQQARAVLPGSIPEDLPPTYIHRGPSPHGDGRHASPISLPHSRGGEEPGSQAAVPRGRGKGGPPWSTFTQILTCRASRAGRPAERTEVPSKTAGTELTGQTDRRSQEPPTPLTTLSTKGAPHTVADKWRTEGRSPKGRAQEGHHLGPTGLASDPPQATLVPLGRPGQSPIDCD